MDSAHYFENYLFQSFYISEQIGEGMTPIDLVFTCQRSMSEILLNKWNIILLIILKTQLFIFHMLIGLGKDMFPIDFEFTRSKVKVTWVTYMINYVNSFFWTPEHFYYKALNHLPHNNLQSHIR